MDDKQSHQLIDSTSDSTTKPDSSLLQRQPFRFLPHKFSSLPRDTGRSTSRYYARRLSVEDFTSATSQNHTRRRSVPQLLSCTSHDYTSQPSHSHIIKPSARQRYQNSSKRQPLVAHISSIPSFPKLKSLSQPQVTSQPFSDVSSRRTSLPLKTRSGFLPPISPSQPLSSLSPSSSLSPLSPASYYDDPAISNNKKDEVFTFENVSELNLDQIKEMDQTIHIPIKQTFDRQDSDIIIKDISNWCDYLYDTVRKDLPNLNGWLAGNASAISRLSTHLFASYVIPQDVHISVQNPHNRSYDRANELFTSVLTTLQTNPNPNTVFIDFIESLDCVGLKTKLIEKLKRSCGYKKKLQSPMQYSFRRNPLPFVRSPQVVSLSSQDEVIIEMESLHKHFDVLEPQLRKGFEELVDTGQLELIDINRQAAKFLCIDPAKFERINNIDKLFDALLFHCDFFNCKVLNKLVQKYLSCRLPRTFSKYMRSVNKFLKSTQLNSLLSHIDEALPNIAETQVVEVTIKLEDSWKTTTIKNLKKVFKHYFGPETSNTFHHFIFKYSSIFVKFLVPNGCQVQSLIDNITTQSDSMNRVGVLEISVNKEQKFANKGKTIDFEYSLQQSVIAGNKFETSLLLQLGADANCKNEEGKTPLILATEHEHIALVNTLVINGGADVFMTDNEGHTALMIAKDMNNMLLIESIHKAEQEAIYTNHVILTKGCEKGNIELVESFIERNISVNVILPNGSTPLIIACQNGHYDLVQLLVQQQVNLSTLDSKGYTALHYACENGSIKIASLLLEHNAPYCYTTDGITPLMLATQHGHLPIIELLYSHRMISHYDGLQAMTVTESPQVLELLDINDTCTKEQLEFLANEEVKEKENVSSVKLVLQSCKIISPSPCQCREAVLQLKDSHEEIYINKSSPDMILLLVPPLVKRYTVRKLGIYYTPITLACLRSLSLTTNTSLQDLALSYCSINDEGVHILCEELRHNTTLTSLDLCGNFAISAASAKALSQLITTNSSLINLDMRRTSVSADGVLKLLDSLTINDSLKKLRLNKRDEMTCVTHNRYPQIQHKLSFKYIPLKIPDDLFK